MQKKTNFFSKDFSHVCDVNLRKIGETINLGG
jgi:hypothetical protein